MGALVTDLGLMLFFVFFGEVLLDAMQLARFAFGPVGGGVAATLVVTRTFGLSLGNVTFKLSVRPDQPHKLLLRTLVLWVPGLNLLDAVHALWDPEHRTWIDRVLGVSVVDATFRL